MNAVLSIFVRIFRVILRIPVILNCLPYQNFLGHAHGNPDAFCTIWYRLDPITASFGIVRIDERWHSGRWDRAGQSPGGGRGLWIAAEKRSLSPTRAQRLATSDMGTANQKRTFASSGSFKQGTVCAATHAVEVTL